MSSAPPPSAPTSDPAPSSQPGQCKGPLSGRLVLDLGRVIAAPYAAQTLADLGAEVIKIERPGSGDDARHYPSVRLPGSPGQAVGDTAHFVSVNRNKQSLCLDLAQPEGQALLKRLAAQADVLIENFKAGDLDARGLGYAALSALNPRLVYCSLTGFGQSGPYAERGGFDPVAQAMSGLMNLTGGMDNEPGGGPRLVTGIVLEDLVAGKDAATAILAALYERDCVSGLGQYIDASLLDSAVALMSHAAQAYFISGQAPRRHPTGGVEVGISGTLNCQDGQVYFTTSRNHFFVALCDVLGCPELARDPRYASPQLRWQQQQPLMAQVQARAQHWRARALADALADRGVPAGPVYALDQTFEDPQVQHRRLRVPLPHPDAPDLDVVASPLRLSRTPVRYELPPPLLGEHSAQVLRDKLGLSDAQIAALRRNGSI